MRVSRSVFAAISAAFIFALAACSSDATGPSNVDNEGALQSLTIGINSINGVNSGLAGAMVPASLAGYGSLVDQANVTIDGKPYSMFGLGLRESFPAGTCLETLFVVPALSPAEGQCTPPPLSVVLILWQTTSANAAPDRLLVISADVGTSDFDFLSSLTTMDPNANPALALYTQGQSNVWISSSGSLTTDVASTAQGCSLPLPPFAKSATCNVATFSEHGAITFEDLSDVASGGKTVSVTIPQQTLHGMWQNITETKPYVVTTRSTFGASIIPSR